MFCWQKKISWTCQKGNLLFLCYACKSASILGFIVFPTMTKMLTVQSIQPDVILHLQRVR